jgi:KDO2-lipid IV(A) lauroyltransferase
MYALGTVLAVLMRDVVRYRVHVARDNLSKALPELDAAARRRVLRRHYRVFADVLFELPGVAIMQPAELRARVRLPDLPMLRADYERGHPVLMLTGHQCTGNGSAGRGARCGRAVPVRVQAAAQCECRPPDARLRVALACAWCRASACCGKCWPARHGARSAWSLTRCPPAAPGACGLNSSGATPPSSGTGIARAGAYSAYFLALRRIRRGFYEARFEPLAVAGENLGVEEFTARYAAHVEALVREWPEDWAWTHRRWKLQRPSSPPSVPAN